MKGEEQQRKEREGEYLDDDVYRPAHQPRLETLQRNRQPVQEEDDGDTDVDDVSICSQPPLLPASLKKDASNTAVSMPMRNQSRARRRRWANSEENMVTPEKTLRRFNG